VTNRPDGQVEALVEGDEEAVDRVEHALRRGPIGARVESFEVEAIGPSYRPTGFSVR
jgi:acylphosphatase